MGKRWVGRVGAEAMAKRTEVKPESPRQLTSEQTAALDTLATGQTTDAAAIAAGVTVRTVTAWLRFDPAFMAALNTRRSEQWRAAVTRLERLIPPSLDAIEAALGGSDGWKVGLAVLKLMGISERRDFGPQTVEAVIASEGERVKHARLFGPSEWERDTAIAALDAELKREIEP